MQLKIWLVVLCVVATVVCGQEVKGGAAPAPSAPTVSVRVMLCKPDEQTAACVPQLLALATPAFEANRTLGGKMWGFRAFEASGIPFTYQTLGTNPYFVTSIESVNMTPKMGWFVTVNNDTATGNNGIGGIALDVNDEVDWRYQKIGTPSHY